MTLQQLIEGLRKLDPATVAPRGFHNPHSWRGVYAELAFEPTDGPATVGELLACAESALGQTYEGWKGGDFTMQGDTDVHIDYEGQYGGADMVELWFAALSAISPALAASPASVSSPQNKDLAFTVRAWEAAIWVLQGERDRAIASLQELDGVIDFTEALGKGDATIDDTELDYLVREAHRLAAAATPLGVVEPGGWVPVSERLPEPAPNAASGSLRSVPVLAKAGNGQYHIATYGSRWDEWQPAYDSHMLQGVTHWQPLPAAPQA